MPKAHCSSPARYTPPLVSHMSCAACWAGPHRLQVLPVYVPPAASQRADPFNQPLPPQPASDSTIPASTAVTSLALQPGPLLRRLRRGATAGLVVPSVAGTLVPSWRVGDRLAAFIGEEN